MYVDVQAGFRSFWHSWACMEPPLVMKGASHFYGVPMTV